MVDLTVPNAFNYRAFDDAVKKIEEYVNRWNPIDEIADESLSPAHREVGLNSYRGQHRAPFEKWLRNNTSSTVQPRILITGSRDWDEPVLIEYAFRYWQSYFNESWRFMREHYYMMSPFQTPKPPTPILISGHCPSGADLMGETYAEELGWEAETYPAMWSTEGKQAGFNRNRKMVDTRPDLCIAFNLNDSKGTKHCLEYAVEQNIFSVEYRLVDTDTDSLI